MAAGARQPSVVVALLARGSAALMLAAVASLAAKGWRMTAAAGPARSAQELGPVVVVTAAWVSLLYVFLFNQSATATAEHRRLRREAQAQGGAAPTLAAVKYGAVPSALMLCATRTVGNFLEQALPFLLALYAHAALVSCRDAARCGWLWLLARSYYPLVYSMRFPALLLSTVPSYLCVAYMLATAVRAL